MAVNSVALLPSLTHRARPRARTSARVHQRWLAVPVLVGVAAHTWMLIAHSHGVAQTLIMLGMTLACLWCAIEILLVPHRRAIVMVLVMSVAMIFAHTAMLLGPAADAGHAHHFAGATAPVTTSPTAMSAFDATMLAIIAVEYVIACCCAIALRRIRAAERRIQTPTLTTN